MEQTVNIFHTAEQIFNVYQTEGNMEAKGPGYTGTESLNVLPTGDKCKMSWLQKGDEAKLTFSPLPFLKHITTTFITFKSRPFWIFSHSHVQALKNLCKPCLHQWRSDDLLMLIPTAPGFREQ